MIRVWVLVTAILLHASTLVSQTEPLLRFVSPVTQDYVSGSVRLAVAMTGGGGGVTVEDVTFFVDGRQVCIAPGAKPECTWNAGAEIKEHVMRAVARLSTGSRLVANVRTRKLDYVESVSVNSVQVNAVVTDGGRFVKGLSRGAFRLLDDGEDRPLSNFEPQGAPLELILALDISNSMFGALSDVKAAARAFLKGLGPKDQVTLVAFNNTMFTLTQRETDSAVRERAIESLTVSGGTAFYDVIVRSFEQLGQRSGRRALVLFSDGEDRSSLATYEQVQKLVADSDVTLFSVGLGRGARVPELKEKLEALADASGGRALFVESSDELDRPFAEILDDLSNQYSLGFEPRRDGRSHIITVQIPGRSYRIRARKGYTAPKS